MWHLPRCRAFRCMWLFASLSCGDLVDGFFPGGGVGGGGGGGGGGAAVVQ